MQLPAGVGAREIASFENFGAVPPPRAAASLPLRRAARACRRSAISAAWRRCNFARHTRRLSPFCPLTMLNPHLALPANCVSLCLLDCHSSIPACLLLVVTTHQGGLTLFCSTSSSNIWKSKPNGVLAWIDLCVRLSVLGLMNGGTVRGALASRHSSGCGGVVEAF